MCDWRGYVKKEGAGRGDRRAERPSERKIVGNDEGLAGRLAERDGESPHFSLSFDNVAPFVDN